MAHSRTRRDIEDDVTENMEWDESMSAYLVIGETEWEADMDGVRIVDGLMYVDGDAVSEAIRTQCQDNHIEYRSMDQIVADETRGLLRSRQPSET